MIFFVLSLVFLLLCTPASNAISISHGAAAPEFTLPSIEGKTVSLGTYKGNVLVMIFWRTGQQRSVLALQDARDILKKYKGKDITVVSIIEDSDNKEDALMIYRENDIDYTLLIDNDRQVYGDYGVRVFPTTVIIDRQGMIAYDIPSHPLTYKTKLRGYIKKTLGEIDESELEEELSPHKEARDETSLEATRLYNLALKFTESRMLDMAVNTAIKSVTASPEMGASHILLGFLYLESKDTDQAIASFTRALELDPESHDAKTGLGGALVLKGEADRAIEILNSAAVTNPYPQMTYYELGKAYELKGDRDRSIEMYKKAIDKIIHKQILPSSVSRCK